jgi:hypothetical protein
MISTRIKKRAQNQSLFTGKGYVDGAGDGIQAATRQSPAASATGLFIFSDSPNDCQQASKPYSEKNP